MRRLFFAAFVLFSWALVPLWSQGPSSIPGGGGGPGGGAGYAATSTTSLAINTGSATFATQTGLAYSAGARVRASSTANTANYMEGLVTAYSGTSLTINVDTTGGSGTHADWNINVAGNVGVGSTFTDFLPAYTTSQTVQSSWCGHLVPFNGSNLTVTLANPPIDQCPFGVVNWSSSTTLIIALNGLTLNGSSSAPTAIPALGGGDASGWTIWTDGSNYAGFKQSAGSAGSNGTNGTNGTNGANGASNVISAIPNDGSTGTTNNNLAKINASGNYVLIGTGDTNIPVVIVVSGGGTAGNPTVAVAGTAPCQSDAGGITLGHFVVASTSIAGRCHDAGATAPTSGWVIGQAQSAAAANANSQIVLSAGYAAASGGAGGSCAGTTNAVCNNSANTFTTGDQNLSAATSFELPVGAGLTAGADGRAGYDSTNQFTHFRTSGADSTPSATIASGSFTESKNCTASSAASVAFTSTVTIPSSSVASLNDNLDVYLAMSFTSPAANRNNMGVDLLWDGSPIYTLLSAPATNIGTTTDKRIVQEWLIWPSVIGASGTITADFLSPYNGSNQTGSALLNGTAPLTGVNLSGATHTIGAQIECTAATGVNGMELYGIKVVRR